LPKWSAGRTVKPRPSWKSNLLTLLRDGNRDGTVDERHDLLTDLSSPFGVAWYNGTLYVAAADAILSYPYELAALQSPQSPLC
jgi:glucose/arabinose dehydrogenase